MTNTPELYCCRCQSNVTPLRGLINYHCPKCRVTFMASQVEQAIADESTKTENAEAIPVAA
jgi:hypothetical protein